MGRRWQGYRKASRREDTAAKKYIRAKSPTTRRKYKRKWKKAHRKEAHTVNEILKYGR